MMKWGLYTAICTFHDVEHVRSVHFSVQGQQNYGAVIGTIVRVAFFSICSFKIFSLLIFSHTSYHPGKGLRIMCLNPNN